MNENTRNKFASYGLEILKWSVLQVLYERHEESPRGPERALKPSDFSKYLDISPPQVTSSDRHALFYGILDHLHEDRLVYHYLHVGWAITEKGVKAIEGSATVAREAQRGSEANTLEDRVEIGRKVAELRINAAGSTGIAWRKIRERLGLKNNEFHNGIRLEDHFHESVVERIESFEDGWEYNGKLDRLLGFKPVGELANRIEACKPKPAPTPSF